MVDDPQAVAVAAAAVTADAAAQAAMSGWVLNENTMAETMVSSDVSSSFKQMKKLGNLF
jgi:hypothetical protein